MVIRCSNLSRPMNCHGYVAFKDLPESEAGIPAQEGTAAGELLKRILLNEPIPSHAENGIFFDEDMHFYAKNTSEEIRSKAQSEISCEQRIDWQTSSGIWIRGQYDTSFVSDRKLYIDDYKYGWILIEPEKNWQLLGYMIGEVLRRQEAFTHVVMRIHQPRQHHEDGSIRSWEISFEELLKYKQQIEDRMTEIAAGVKTLSTGKDCRYCEASAEACPAFNRLSYRSMEVTHDFIQDSINNDELALQLKQVERAIEVLKIKSDSIKALAVNRIREGQIIKGYITQKSYGHRQWNNGISPEIVKALTGENITMEKVLSPAQAEKMGVNKKIINQLASTKFIGQKLIKKDAVVVANDTFGTNKPTRS